jgi:hypothetical protein
MSEKINEDTLVAGLSFSDHAVWVSGLAEPYRSILLHWDEVRAVLSDLYFQCPSPEILRHKGLDVPPSYGNAILKAQALLSKIGEAGA